MSKNPASNSDKKKSIKSQFDYDLSQNFSIGQFNCLSLLSTMIRTPKILMRTRTIHFDFFIAVSNP